MELHVRFTIQFVQHPVASATFNAFVTHDIKPYREYGKIDNLHISYDGNRITTVLEDADAVTQNGSMDYPGKNREMAFEYNEWGALVKDESRGIKDSSYDNFGNIAPSYNGFFGFSDGADKAVEYEYDANGNMTRDRNKGISSITHNVGNLPLRIQYGNGSRATYRYAADGTKLQVRYDTSYAGLLSNGSQGGSVSTAIAQTHIIDYVGNRIYEDGRLNKILVDGGYVDYNGGNPVYNAYLTDHQGNIRMVVSEGAAVRQVDHYYPYGALMAAGPGVNVQRYLYNGKELDRMHGLDWYDYGARHYDAAIGRWHSMDDMCYAYYDISPYAYCCGDPVNAIDPDGKDVYVYATTLPNASRKLDLATHTFITVTKEEKVVGYFAYGSEYDGVKGAVSGRLCQRTYDQDISIYSGTNKDQSLLKAKIHVDVPDGMTQDEFDQKIIDVANSFGNVDGINYFMIPFDTTQGNCNTSTTTILHKAGVGEDQLKQIDKQIPMIVAGFGTVKPWTKEEQERAIYE